MVRKNSSSATGMVRAATLPDTPLGPLWIQVTERGLAKIEFRDCAEPQPCEDDGALLFSGAPILLLALEQMRDYLDGRRRAFDLPIDWHSMSPFQKRVLEITHQIPYGLTRTYGNLADELGQPGSSRAVGMALGKNPLPIVIPCHRVMGNNGHLQGYSAPDGLAKKTWLLKLEGVLLFG